MRSNRRATPHARRPRRLVPRLLLALVVTLLIGALVGTVVAQDDEDASSSTTTTVGNLRGDAEELAEALERRQTATYHARYEGRSGDDATVVIETWQDGTGNVRQDQILAAADQAAHLVTLDGDGGSIQCRRLGEVEWTCQRGTAGVDDPLSAIRARLADSEVTARTSQVDGTEARCYELVAGEGTSELCVRPDTGIPVRITGGTTTLRAVLIEETVDPAVFEPPGPVVG